MLHTGARLTRGLTPSPPPPNARAHAFATAFSQCRGQPSLAALVDGLVSGALLRASSRPLLYAFKVVNILLLTASSRPLPARSLLLVPLRVAAWSGIATASSCTDPDALAKPAVRRLVPSPLPGLTPVARQDPPTGCGSSRRRITVVPPKITTVNRHNP